MIVKWPDCGQGVNKDQTPEEINIGVWSDAKNMRFRNGYAERFGGMKNLFSATSVTPYFITYFQSPTSRYWVHCGTQKVFADDGFTRTEITPASLFTGAVDDRWTAAVINTILVLNNGVETPKWWNGDTATDLADLPTWDATWKCKAMVSFKDYLIALNVTKGATRYPSMVKWSSAALPGSLPSTWDETDVTKEAGEIDLSETPDQIIDAMRLGDALVIYKERSMYLLSYIGQPYIFRIQKIPYESGLLSTGCVADTPVGHVCLTNGDVIVHNGGAPKSIANGRVRDYIFRNLSSTNYNRAFLVTNPQKFEVLICYPTEGSEYCNKAVTWNWVDDTFGVRDLTDVTYADTGLVSLDYSLQTWAGDSGSWSSDASIWSQNEYSSTEARVIFSRVGYVSAFDVGADDFGTPFTSYLERTGISFDMPEIVKTIRKIHPRIEANSGSQVSIELGAAFAANSAPTYQQASTFTVGTDFKADGFTSGRYVAIKLSASTAWRLRSLDFDVVKNGAF